jgi:hypothetical protein
VLFSSLFGLSGRADWVKSRRRSVGHFFIRKNEPPGCVDLKMMQNKEGEA